MDTALRFCGYLGMVLLAFGIAGSMVVGSFSSQPLLLLHIVIGFLCLTLWFLTSGISMWGQTKTAMSGRMARFGVHAGLYSVVAVGLIVVVNVFAALNERRWDLTEQGVYSLSPKTTKVVSSLKQPVRFVALDNPQVQATEQTRELLNLYRYANDKRVSFEIIDPRTRPVEVDALGMKQGNLLYVAYGEESQKAVARINQIDEQSITNAIIKLTRGASKRVYYVQGHGEPALDSRAQGGLKEFSDALSDEHVTVQGLILAVEGSVPEDAAAVFVVAPKKEIPEEELRALESYVQSGGRLLLFNNPEDRASKSIRTLASKFGIAVGEDMILDQQLRLFAGPQMAVQFVAQDFGAHAITEGMTRTEPLIFTFASSVSKASSADSKAEYETLVRSGANSWAESNVSGLFAADGATASLDSEDIAGPVSLAVVMERTIEQKTDDGSGDTSFGVSSRVVVFGDATWIENGNLSAMGNRDLALNAVNWSIGEEGGVAIGPKKMRASVAPIPQATFNIILALSFLGPELILVLGLFVWWKRRASFV
jgi:ABC-type uncharacterized transport system involved in gliding motility auxiliary subunit